MLSSGSFKFFRFAGVQVYVHWSWFIVAWLEISTRGNAYSSPVWNVVEYLGLFGIVLLHEFGHVFACRQVGGQADEIVLWPLGGVAMGRPPPRPGAELWTIAAGPLVNVVLFPVLMLATMGYSAAGLSSTLPDLERLLFMLWLINKWLLIFNLLPVYPLDGGQILRSLLWFGLGRARSLQVAAGIGLGGIVLLVIYRLQTRADDWLWTLLLAFFLGQQCFAGFRQAVALRVLEKLPRYAGYSCRSCQTSPPRGAIWLCQACGQRFDAFANDAVCPHCRNRLAAIACVECGTALPLERWENVPRARSADAPPIIDV